MEEKREGGGEGKLDRRGGKRKEEEKERGGDRR